MNDLEFFISQYLDGTLNDADRRSLEARLDADPEAQALLAEYRKLNASLVSLPQPPAVRWDGLADQISRAVAEWDDLELAASDQKLDEALKCLPAMPTVRWDALSQHISKAIDRQGHAAGSYKLFGRFSSGRLALAASLLLAVGLAMTLYVRNAATTPGTVQPVGPVAINWISEVGGPVAEVAEHPVLEVKIGPASTLASGSIDYVDDVSSRPSAVVIASSAIPSSDVSPLPY